MEKDKIELFTISPDNTIKDAMLKIEENCSNALIVLLENKKVVGTITDGDIRKQLLHQHTLILPVSDAMNTHFVSCTTLF